MTPDVSPSLLDLIGNTPMVKLTSFDTGLCELYVKLEFQNPGGSIKDRIALSIIEDAERSGELVSGGTIIEATAGNTGIGLALVGALKGYQVILVIPDKMSREKIFHLEGLGARIVITRSDVPEGHPEYYQDLARQIASVTKDSFLANQFSNPSNPAAHRTQTAPEIWRQMDCNVDAVVTGVGSGGTVTGLAEFLKEKNPSIQMVVADPDGSVVADAVTKGHYNYDGGSWLVEGIGEDFIPDNLNLSLTDDAVVVSDKEAFRALDILLKKEGILGGSSSGTLIAGAVKWCQKQEVAKRVVTFVCDTGNKYLSKAYNKSWLHDNDLSEKTSSGDLSDLINCRADEGEMIAVASSDTLTTAYNRMRSADVSQIPVIDDSSLVGVLDEGDLLMTVSCDQSTFVMPVSKFMTTNLVILQKDSTIDEVQRVLAGGKVAIIFDADKFLGFVTKVDLINYFRRLA
jgi:cystathionine beta-synthase